jgi:hypothetical protein
MNKSAKGRHSPKASSHGIKQNGTRHAINNKCTTQHSSNLIFRYAKWNVEDGEAVAPPGQGGVFTALMTADTSEFYLRLFGLVSVISWQFFSFPYLVLSANVQLH